jgi:hypothetical protein
MIILSVASTEPQRTIKSMKRINEFIVGSARAAQEQRSIAPLRHRFNAVLQMKKRSTAR